MQESETGRLEGEVDAKIAGGREQSAVEDPPLIPRILLSSLSGSWRPDDIRCLMRLR